MMLVATALAALAQAAPIAPPARDRPVPAPLPRRFQELAAHQTGELRLTSPGCTSTELASAGEDVAWVRVRFDASQTNLAGDAYLRISSILDGHTQFLTATSLAQWQHTSAYFNGAAVRVELCADAAAGVASVGFRGLVEGLIVPPNTPGAESLCGDDTRVPSDLRKAARYLGDGGCTGWLINDTANCFLTAQHCGTDENGSGVMEFQVPLSEPTSGGGYRIVHPPPEDQYALDPASVQESNWYWGNDWQHQGTFPNSNTGLTAYEAQGDCYILSMSTTLPKVNATLRITGYGIVSDPIPVEYNQIQQTSTGPYAYDELRDGNTQCLANNPVKWELYYRVDSTGGNSGSPIVDETNGGMAVGVHTHGGCGRYSGENSGTFIGGNPCLRQALENPKGVCAMTSEQLKTLVSLPRLIA